MILGISGQMGSGKSTAIEALKTLGRPVFVHKFAYPLYMMQEYAYRLIEPVYPKPEGFVKDRRLLQLIGGEWGRETISQSIWTDLWKARTVELTERDPELILVSDDVRFDNEAETVRSLGGHVIRIERKNAATYAEGGVGIQGHASEAGISGDLIDRTIFNEGTIEEFQDNFRGLIAQIESSGNNT